MTKLCSECKWYHPGTSRWTDLCDHPQAQQQEPVRGEAVPLVCLAMRERLCLDGKLWEPKLSEAA